MSQPLHTPISMTSISAQMQKRFNEFKKRINGNPGIAPEAKTSLVNDVCLIGQEYDMAQRMLQQEIDRMQEMKESSFGQLEKTRGQLETAMADCDEYSGEKQALQRIIDDLRVKVGKHNEEMDQVNAKWKKIQADLTSRMKVMEEQLSGKRALWLDTNPNSSIKREAMESIVDPFTSPTRSSGRMSFIDNGYLGMNRPPPILKENLPENGTSIRKPGEVQTQTSHPPLSVRPAMNVNERRSLRRQPNLVPGQLPSRPGSFHNLGPANYQIQSVLHDTGPRSPPESKALILHTQEEEKVNEYKADFQSVYGMVEGWVRTYCDKPFQEVDQQLYKSHPRLWEFLTSLTYHDPNTNAIRRDAHVHSLALLNDPNARFWFVMRGVVSYLIKDVICFATWKGFNTAVDSSIDASMNALGARGLAVDARQPHLDTIHKAIQTIVSHKDYQRFRSHNLTRHTKAVRDLVGPLLNVGCDRSKAGRDLGILIMRAWDLSAKANTSHQTFSIIFPDLNSKFISGVMIAKDRPDADPLQLQVQGTRLKLVITPVVTLRDDRGTTIRAKNLHNAFVLTMNWT